MDRNNQTCRVKTSESRSLSARRAWIEISVNIRSFLLVLVALRKESVDRNLIFAARHMAVGVSLSARRAWIEIVSGAITAYPVFPSLSARRAWIEIGRWW